MIFSKKRNKKRKIKSKKNKKKKGGMKKNTYSNTEPSFTDNDSSEEIRNIKIDSSGNFSKGKEKDNQNDNSRKSEKPVPFINGLPNIFLNRMESLPSISDKSNESNNGRKSALSNSGVVKFVREYMTPKQGAKLRASTPNQSIFSNENSKYKNIPYKQLENHYLYPSFSECNNIKNIKEKYKCNELKFHENLTSFYDLFKELNIKEDIPTIWKVIIGSFKPEYYNKASKLYKLELIPDLCFQNHNLLSKIIKIPESVKNIGEKAFEGCGIEDVIFTGNVNLDNDCFRKNNIKKLDLSKALSIGYNSFRSNKLEELTLPHVDVKINPYTFQSSHNNIRIIRNIRPSMIFKDGIIESNKRVYEPDFSFGTNPEWLEKGYYLQKDKDTGIWIKNLDERQPEIKRCLDETTHYFKI